MCPCRSAVELESTYSSRLNFRLNQSHIRAGSISQISHVASTWVAIGIYRGLEEGGGREPGLRRGTFSINRGRMMAYLVPIVPLLSNRIIGKTREREKERVLYPRFVKASAKKKFQEVPTQCITLGLFSEESRRTRSSPSGREVNPQNGLRLTKELFEKEI